MRNLLSHRKQKVKYVSVLLSFLKYHISVSSDTKNHKFSFVNSFKLSKIFCFVKNVYSENRAIKKIKILIYFRKDPMERPWIEPGSIRH